MISAHSKILAAFLALLIPVACNQESTTSTRSTEKTDSTRSVPVTFTGGFETNPVDRGSPVVLIASALGIPEQVFRDAFSNVNPAPGGTNPTRERERANKEVLMQALSPYGITNDRLDEVSNYYRYRPQAGEMWPHEEAEAVATVEDGKVTSIEILRAGHGYSSEPTVTLEGFPDLDISVTIRYSTDFQTNGSISSVGLFFQ